MRATGILTDEQFGSAILRDALAHRSTTACCVKKSGQHEFDGANLHRTVQSVRALGKRVGVVINPAMPAAVLEEILPDVPQAHVMTVDPGFGNQHFLHSSLAKISRVRQMIDRVRPECDLEVDGGIDSERRNSAWEREPTFCWPGHQFLEPTKGVPEAVSRLRAGEE